MTIPDNDGKKLSYEHERRFVPDIKVFPFNYKQYPSKSILQGYFKDEEKTRLRHEYDEHKHTYLETKKKGAGVSRIEDEKEITEDIFNAKWKNVCCSLKKTRYFITFNETLYELNIFHGNLDGYIQIEVEFKTHEDALAFIPPAWLGKEVTDDKAHNNSTLAKYGLPKP